METLYVVFGKTGEYDSYREWEVCAYTDNASADAHVEALNARLRLLDLFSDRDNDIVQWYEKEQQAKGEMKDLDPHFQLDYTGVDYDMFELNVYDSFYDWGKAYAPIEEE